MTSWKNVSNDELRRQWAVALAAEVGDQTHAELGKHLVELAAEIDRRVAGGARDLLVADRTPLARTFAAEISAESGALRAYIVRRSRPTVPTVRAATG